MKKVLLLLLVLILLFSVVAGLSVSPVDPISVASGRIHILVNNLGAPSKECAYFARDTILASKPIAEFTDTLGTEQVCVLMGNSISNDGRFEVLLEGKSIRYSDPDGDSFSLWTLCSRGNELAEDLEDTGLNDEVDYAKCSTEFREFMGTTQRTCVVAISETEDNCYPYYGPSFASSIPQLFFLFLALIVSPLQFIFGLFLLYKRKIRNGVIAIVLSIFIFLISISLAVLFTPLYF
ncbi:MAG: hypothetical protein ABID38_02470 [Candidatus Diapherotrites archaeon]